MRPKLLFLALLPHALAASICYFPNGETAKDVPCDPDAPFTQCCGTRSACLTNGLCALSATNTTGTSYARGTCTDKSWASPLCPQKCQLNQDTPTNTSAYDFRASGVQVWQCGSEGFARDARFCCESEAESKRCCSTESAVFTLKAAAVGASTSVVVTSSSVVLSSSLASSARSLTTGPTPTGSGAASSPTAVSEKKSNKAVEIGAGVGGAVLFCILVLVAMFFVRTHKKRNKSDASEVHETTVKEERKSPAELAIHPVELPPNPQPVWELPATPQMKSTRSSRVVN